MRMRPLEFDVDLLPIFFLLTAVNMFGVSVAGDTITVNHSIVSGQTLISSGGAFELGFFSPAGSKNRYVGIWYHAIPDQTVVWVANRESPLAVADTSGDLRLTADGNLTLRDNRGQALWSTATSNVINPVVQLLDSGNLVLRNDVDDTTKVVAWQSFDYPTNTLIPGMKLGRDLKTHRDWRLRSWRTTSDPSPGIYSLGLDLRGAPELYIWNGSAPEARTGPWDGTSWGGSGSLRSNNIFTTQFISTQDEFYYIDELVNASMFTRQVLDELGMSRRLVWQDGKWRVYWTGPTDQCDVYAECGANGVCNSGLSPICTCLTGFVPKSPLDWSLQDVSGGCRRRTALDCPAGDGFLKVGGVKLPDSSNATIGGNIGIDACRKSCLNNCSCLAFAYLGEASGCISWHSDLIDVRDLSTGTGEDLYLRLAASELDTQTNTRSKKHVLVIVIVTSSLVALILIALIYFLWMRRYGKRGAREVSTEQFLLTLDNTLTIDDGKNEDNSLKFSVFNFSTIVAATNDFSNTNKLGEGGFGPVYKGQLPEGQDIAVKRLSENSGQGVEEFKNEIILIAKLQHRNLVRLLGCCIHEDEKILIYEYMTNKSLDLYLFDSDRGRQLDWSKRFHIIEGIAQGLLYLHKHSRLRIIHRDLKASNILLDVDMNPKISDFGLARIFGSNETQAKTRRIVGTYGYMSPEYAAGGLFSIKSDVFSFGVILLEIISGKRNTGFYQHEDSFNLLGYAWVLWKESKWLELVDPLLVDNGNMDEISRCIYVALMCVQESFVDRPTMSDAITMLHSETTPLSNPMQPAFFNVSIAAEVKSSSSISKICSVNELTITVVASR